MKKQNKKKQEKKKKRNRKKRKTISPVTPVIWLKHESLVWISSQSTWTERNSWMWGLEMCHAPLIYLQASMNQYYSMP